MYAKGTYSKGICDRCGWKYDYLELQWEPGTRLKVCPECNDGEYSRVSHPQNYAPKKLVDRTALRDPRPLPPAEETE